MSCSYDIAGKKDAELKAKFQVMIVDECHLLKSASAKRTQKISPVIQACKRGAYYNSCLACFFLTACFKFKSDAGKMWKSTNLKV